MTITTSLKQSRHTVKDFLRARGLSESDITALEDTLTFAAVRPLPKMMKDMLISQIPAIGIAIAKGQGREFLDIEERQPLSIPENALHYGFHQVEEFLRGE